MEPSFWTTRWEQGQTGFHRPAPHGILTAHWPALGIPRGARVLVPLCGKSHDLRWLLDQGYQVTGIELSELAIRAFFQHQGWEPTRYTQGSFTAWTVPNLTILQGDIFGLNTHDRFDAAYDRAATIALPPHLRTKYASLLASILMPGAPLMLISLQRAQPDLDGPPFHVDEAEIQRLYGTHFTCDMLAAPQASERERPWLLRRLAP